MSRGGRDSLDDQLRILKRLMSAGGEMAVSDLLDGDAGRRDAVTSHLARLAKHLPQLITGRKDGTAWRYRFRWPHEASVNPTRVLAARLAHRLLAALGESAIGDELKSLVEDLDARALGRDRLPPDLSRLFYAKSRMFNPLGADPAVLDSIARAAINTHLIEFEYTTWNAKTLRVVVEPWTVVFADDGIYVFGMTRDSTVDKYIGTKRIFNIMRIRNLRPRLDQPFSYPNREQYDPQTVFQHSIGVFVREDGEPPERVVVRFKRRWDAYLHLHRWHASQTPPKDIDEGWVEVEFTLLITAELSRWLRGFGKDIEVITPARLRDWVESGNDP